MVCVCAGCVSVLECCCVLSERPINTLTSKARGNSSGYLPAPGNNGIIARQVLVGNEDLCVLCGPSELRCGVV